MLTRFQVKKLDRQIDRWTLYEQSDAEWFLNATWLTLDNYGDQLRIVVIDEHYCGYEESITVDNVMKPLLWIWWEYYCG